MFTPGQKFQHFTIIKKLGEGGMGEVYLAQDEKLGRQVALKSLSSEYFDKSEQLDRFSREARTAAQVNHPNIMAIYDFGTGRDESGKEITYIVMEYVRGVSLTEYLRNSKPELGKVLRLAEKIAAGLAAAHKLNIVHRDIKGDNILVDESGEPKILDFGLAKPVAPVKFEETGTKTVSQELTRVGKILGTVTYMSPEQVRGEVVDTRSDIFSYGILLYRLATGNLPFAGSTQVSTLAKILEATPEPPHIKNAQVPPELERIIDKCLQKNPDDRYQDTRDLVVDLRNLRRLYDSGVTETVTGVTARISPRPKPEKKGFLQQLTWKQVVLLVFVTPFAFALFVVLIQSIGGGNGDDGVEYSEAEVHEQRLAILGFENKTGDSTYNWLETGLPEILMTDLSQNEATEIISRERLTAHLTRSGKGRDYGDFVEAARSLGATTLLSGSFYKMGERIRIDARLEDLETGRIMMGDKVIGADPFTMVDSLTNKVSLSLNLAQGPRPDANVTSLTTASPEAYKEYHLGMELFADERFDDAVEQFRKAIAIDSAFALPYMRIGMSHMFQGRPAQAAQYLALAQRYEKKLPPRERGLLDVYADFWLNRKFDDASVKLSSLMQVYGDDSEIRTINAMLLAGFYQDTAGALAHYDTVLRAEPTYTLAIQQKGLLFQNREMYDSAARYYEQIREYRPESPAAYRTLFRLYQRQEDTAAARQTAEEFVDRIPDNPDGYSYLTEVHIRAREFDKALRATNQLKERFSDDPFVMRVYYHNLATLDEWQGKFKSVVRRYLDASKESLKSKDSALIFVDFQTISNHYENIGQKDSSLAFAQKGRSFAGPFQKLNFPILMVSLDPASDSSARPAFNAALQDFRARMPEQLWSVAEGLEMIYEGYRLSDTGKLIAGLDTLINSSGIEGQGGNIRAKAYLLILTGDYAAGRALLQPYYKGPRQSTDGWVYPYVNYMLGVAEQELGNVQQARTHFEEVIRYWGNAEIRIKELKDTEERLARLRG